MIMEGAVNDVADNDADDSGPSAFVVTAEEVPLSSLRKNECSPRWCPRRGYLRLLFQIPRALGLSSTVPAITEWFTGAPTVQLYINYTCRTHNEKVEWTFPVQGHRMLQRAKRATGAESRYMR